MKKLHNRTIITQIDIHIYIYIYIYREREREGFVNTNSWYFMIIYNFKILVCVANEVNIFRWQHLQQK